MSYEISTFPCPGGGFMRWARLAGPKPARGCVLVFMGWGEWLEKYESIAQLWHERGFETVVAERRGQGLSSRFLENDRSRAWLPGFDVLLRDFSAFYKEYFMGDATPLLLMGHSMGAHLLLRWYAEARPAENIKGAILLSPMQRVKTGRIACPVAEWIAGSAALLGLGKLFAPGQKNADPATRPFAGNSLTRDAGRYRVLQMTLRDNPMLKAGGVTLGWLSAAFASARRLERALKRGAPNGPYLLLGPEDDPLVDSRAMKDIAALLPNCAAHFIKDAAHELLQETDEVRARTWEDLRCVHKDVFRGIMYHTGLLREQSSLAMTVIKASLRGGQRSIVRNPEYGYPPVPVAPPWATDHETGSFKNASTSSRVF